MIQIEQKINDLKNKVNKSDTGHLPLNCRVELMTSLKNPLTVNKIFFECVKKVYPIWINKFPDNSILYDLIIKTHSFLYENPVNKEEFASYYDKYLNYFEEIDDKSSLVGLAEISLCYNITYDATTILRIDDYDGEDDNKFDYDVWNPDFLSSMAYAGGNPFLKEGSVSKRKEFWIWYLDTVYRLSFNAIHPIIKLESTSIKNAPEELQEYSRSQTFKTDSIIQKIDSVLDKSAELINMQDNKDWSKIIIENCSIKAGVSSTIYYLDNHENKNNIDNLEFYEEFSEISQTLNSIKKEMYNQKESERAWIMSKLTINNDRSYTILFNYDNIEEFTKRAKSPNNLILEFENFPRSKEFTPEWWQEILGKKAKYIK